MIDISEKDGALTFAVRVLPRASRCEIAGEADGALRVRISAPPVDGAANAELIRFLSKKLDVAKSNIAIVSGQNSRSKRVRVTGIEVGQARNAIEPAGKRL